MPGRGGQNICSVPEIGRTNATRLIFPPPFPSPFALSSSYFHLYLYKTPSEPLVNSLCSNNQFLRGKRKPWIKQIQEPLFYTCLHTSQSLRNIMNDPIIKKTKTHLNSLCFSDHHQVSSSGIQDFRTLHTSSLKPTKKRAR